MKILAIDIGGTHVKILASGRKQKRAIVSGPKMTARQIVERVKKLAQGWAYEKRPQGCRAGNNANAFVGGFRMWKRKPQRS